MTVVFRKGEEGQGVFLDPFLQIPSEKTHGNYLESVIYESPESRDSGEERKEERRVVRLISTRLPLLSLIQAQGYLILVCMYISRQKDRCMPYLAKRIRKRYAGGRTRRRG